MRLYVLVATGCLVVERSPNNRRMEIDRESVTIEPGNYFTILVLQDAGGESSL
jgi:hypothetical protein